MGYLKIKNKDTGQVLLDSRTDELSAENQLLISWYDELIEKEQDPVLKAKFLKVREAGIQRSIQEAAEDVMDIRRVINRGES